VLLALDGIADADAAVETAAYLAGGIGASIDVRLTLDRAAVSEPEAMGVAGLSSAERRDAVIIRRLGGRLDAAGRLASGRLSEVGGAVFALDRLDGDVRAELPRLALGHDLVLLSNGLRRRADSDDLDVTFALPVEELVRAIPDRSCWPTADRWAAQGRRSPPSTAAGPRPRRCAGRPCSASCTAARSTWRAWARAGRRRSASPPTAARSWPGAGRRRWCPARCWRPTAPGSRT
jgi:hypothetical protein